MSPSSQNPPLPSKFLTVTNPEILEQILAKRLPLSSNVYNAMKMNKTWKGDQKWFTLQDPLVDDVWIVVTNVRKDYGPSICVSRPPTAQVTTEVRNAFSNCDFMDWDESYLFVGVDPTVSSMVADISIMDKGNCTHVHPNYLYAISQEDALSLHIKTGNFELKPLNNKEGVEFIVKTWKYSNDDTVDYVQKCVDRNISAGIYVDGKVVACALINFDGLTGMLYSLPEFRGQGFGRLVMHQLMKEAAQNGHFPCCCVEIKNEVSKAFQVKIGFKLVGQVNYVKYVKDAY